jgi:hypothetical protein
LPRKSLESAAQPVTLNINTTPASSAAAAEPEKPQVKEEKPPHWFFAHIFELPAAEWGRVWSLELYRLKPDVPGMPGTKGYLRLFNEPITLETLRTTVGGGRFRLNLCKNGRWSTSHEFEIEGQPIYDTNRERPNTNGNGAGISTNADFQKEFIGVLRDELARSRESQNGTPQGYGEVVKMFTDANEKAMEIVTKQTPQAQSGVSQIKEMVEALKGLGLFAAPATTATDPLVNKLLAAAIDRLLAPPPAPKTLKEQLEEAKMIAELVGGGGGEGQIKNPWLIGLKMLEPHLPEIMDSFRTNSQNTIATAQARAAEARSRAAAAESLRHVPQPAATPARAAATPTAAARVAPAAPSISVDGGLRLVPRDAADSEPAAAAPVVESPTPGIVQPAGGEWTQEKQDEFDTALKINMVNMMRTGASGGAIAAYVEDCKPEMAKDFVKYPAHVIRDFFLADPVLKFMVEDPRWDEVLADAKDYLAEEVTVH